MFGGFSYDIQINTTNPEDMDNLDILLNFDWMNHVANQMEVEMAFQMERKYPKEQDRKVFRLSKIFDGLFYQVANSPKISIKLVKFPKFSIKLVKFPKFSINRFLIGDSSNI